MGPALSVISGSFKDYLKVPAALYTVQFRVYILSGFAIPESIPVYVYGINCSLLAVCQ